MHRILEHTVPVVHVVRSTDSNSVARVVGGVDEERRTGGQGDLAEGGDVEHDRLEREHGPFDRLVDYVELERQLTDADEHQKEIVVQLQRVQALAAFRTRTAQKVVGTSIAQRAGLVGREEEGKRKTALELALEREKVQSLTTKRSIRRNPWQFGRFTRTSTLMH